MGKPKQNKRFCRRNADNQFLVCSGLQNMENALLHSTVCSPLHTTTLSELLSAECLLALKLVQGLRLEPKWQWPFWYSTAPPLSLMRPPYWCDSLGIVGVRTLQKSTVFPRFSPKCALKRHPVLRFPAFRALGRAPVLRFLAFGGKIRQDSSWYIHQDESWRMLPPNARKRSTGALHRARNAGKRSTGAVFKAKIEFFEKYFVSTEGHSKLQKKAFEKSSSIFSVSLLVEILDDAFFTKRAVVGGNLRYFWVRNSVPWPEGSL